MGPSWLPFWLFIFILTMSQKTGFVITLASILFTLFSSSWLAVQALLYHPVELSLQFGSFAGEVLLKIDGLSAWFILIINFTVLTGFFYGKGYLKKYEQSRNRISLHWIFFSFSPVHALCLYGSEWIRLLVVWEIMSLTSMLLVLFDHENQKTFKAALNYFVQMHIGVTFLTIGFIWVYHYTGSFSYDALNTYFQSNRNLWLFLLFFTGFGIKAGFIPFHSWLPHAHPAAPAHISGIMSGVMVKLGIYGILRMITFLKSDFLLLGEIVLTLSVLSGLYDPERGCTPRLQTNAGILYHRKYWNNRHRNRDRTDGHWKQFTLDVLPWFWRRLVACFESLVVQIFALIRQGQSISKATR